MKKLIILKLPYISIVTVMFHFQISGKEAHPLDDVTMSESQGVSSLITIHKEEFVG